MITILPLDGPGNATEQFNYAEIALDEGTWDLAIPVRVLKGSDAIVQRIKVRIRFFLGEWFLDRRQGVPYYQQVLIKNPDQILVSSVFRKVLRTTPGVKTVDSVIGRLESRTRELTLDFKCHLDTGAVVVSKATPFII